MNNTVMTAKKAEANNAAARVWISGLEIVSEKAWLQKVIDLFGNAFLPEGIGLREDRSSRGQ